MKKEYASLIEGEYRKKYYLKYGELPTKFDTIGRLPIDKQEQILRTCLEKNLTWQKYTGQKINDLE